jgi:hypothetical protein
MILSGRNNEWSYLALPGVGECMKSSGAAARRKGNAYWVRSKRLLRLSRERLGDRRRLCCRLGGFEREKRVEMSALRGCKLNNNNSIPRDLIHLIYNTFQFA